MHFWETLGIIVLGLIAWGGMCLIFAAHMLSLADKILDKVYNTICAIDMKRKMNNIR
jgi:hypothetical protein